MAQRSRTSEYSLGWTRIYVTKPFPLQELLGQGSGPGWYKYKMKRDGDRFLAIFIASDSLPNNEEYPHVTVQINEKKEFFSPHFSLYNDCGNKVSLDRADIRAIARLVQLIVESSDEALIEIAKFLI